MNPKKAILKDLVNRRYDTTTKKTADGITVTRIPKLDSVKPEPLRAGKGWPPAKKIVPEQKTNKPISRYGTVETPNSISRTAPGGLTKEEMVSFFSRKRNN